MSCSKQQSQVSLCWFRLQGFVHIWHFGADLLLALLVVSGLDFLFKIVGPGFASTVHEISEIC